ncbi:glycosyltransferase [Macrococcoides goetzii]|uniref:Glycosyltransferase n=1 Tax=Macrococcoides goetzii TaxID=1891097 RepID=A0A395G7C5_9STAP|nr:glycosyltransferase [Macrococcus goetzii]RAI79924.1 glycosyltransferase [Macrococcus goetzii]
MKILVYGNYDSPHISTWEQFYEFDNNNYYLFLSKSDLVEKRNVISEILKIRKFIKENKIDIVHTHSAGIYGIKSLFLNTPFIITIYGSELFKCKDSITRKFIMDIILSNSQSISCTSIASKNVIENLFPKHLKRTFLFNIPATKEFFNENIKGKKYVFSNRRIGSLYHTKEIIKGFIIFKEKNKDENISLYLSDAYSDKGKYSDEVKNLIENSKYKDSIIMDSNIKTKAELNKLYNQSICFINIPKSDQLSLSFLEGVKAGCHPIVSNIDAYSRLITEYNISNIDIENDIELQIAQKIEDVSKGLEITDINSINNNLNSLETSFKVFKNFIGGKNK